MYPELLRQIYQIPRPVRRAQPFDFRFRAAAFPGSGGVRLKSGM
jgi:hypothetical protein